MESSDSNLLKGHAVKLLENGKLLFSSEGTLWIFFMSIYLDSQSVGKAIKYKNTRISLFILSYSILVL